MKQKDKDFIKFLVMVGFGVAGGIAFLIWITGGLK